METFSKRNNFDPRVPKQLISEDAPKLLRLGYWKQILEPLTYIDNDSRYSADGGVIGRKELCEDLCLLLHEEPNDNMSDSWYCTDELRSLVMNSAWYSFYDIIEHVAKKLIAYDNRSYVSEPHFQSYREAVNKQFEYNYIVWRLNNEGVLQREALPELQEGIQEAEEILEVGFPAALQHLRKARRFVTDRPLDPENAIKEAISAVESYGRVLYPDTSTLGDVLKDLRKTPFPALMISMIEKFYAFASAAPGVRHGSSISSQLGLADADFCLYVSTAFIEYLHKLHNK